MNVQELIHYQIEQDKEFGFPISFNNEDEKYAQLSKELIGLFGEVGEFSNIIKKINLKIDNPKYELDISRGEENLKEELVDSFIYLMRIAAILDIDLESATLSKINFNRNRYARLAKK